MALLKAITDLVAPKFDPRKYGRKHTPDILVLQQYKRHLVFIPCNMQKGRHYHHFLKDASPYGSGYTRRKFITYVKDLGKESFPIHLPGILDSDRFVPNAAPSASVHGELYWVSPETLAEKLDNHKLNGVEFNRELVEIKFPYRDPYESTDRDTGAKYTMFTNEMVFMLKAWMYVGIEDYWHSQIDCGYLFQKGTLVKSRKKWNDPQYYEFK